MRTRVLIVGTVAALALTACSGTTTPEVTPPSTEVAASQETPTPTPTPTPEDTTGTRTSPLRPGESRKLANDSAFTVSLAGSDLDAFEAISAADEWATPPAADETFIVGTFTITVDGASLTEQGMDVANEGIDPYWSVTFEYVSADGVGYGESTGTSCYTSNPLYAQPTVYQDGGAVTGDVCIAVPTAAVPGGLWRAANTAGGFVWLAAS